MAATDLQLPDECWESIFKFLINTATDDDNNHGYLESLSLISKQFLSITNHLRFSLTICHPTLPSLPRLFHRFPNLTSLNLTRFTRCFSQKSDLDALLCQISTFPLNHIKSINLSNQPTIPANGLRALSEKCTSLTSLTCSNIDYISIPDIVLISDCFPLLEELDLSYPENVDLIVNPLFFELPERKLRKVNLSGHYYIKDSFLLKMCKSCEFLEEIVMLKCSFITHYGVASAICERPGLKSLSFSKLRLFGIGNHNIFIDSLVRLKGLTCLDFSYSSISDRLLSSIAEKGFPLRKLVLQGCVGYAYVGLYNLLSNCHYFQYLDIQSADFLNDSHVLELSRFLADLVSINISKCGSLTNLALFALLRNCHKLSEVIMEDTCIGKRNVENFYTPMDYVVYPQLRSLCLAHNTSLRDGDINMFASACPNLQLLDLSSCEYISDEGIGQVLRKCSKIRHLNLANCLRLKLLKINFEVSMLEVLNLSHSGIDDRSLYVISMSCFGLLQLDLGRCYDVTKKGVMQVVENCKLLREINLQDCHKVVADVVDLMVFTRPSLRKITSPPGFCCSDSKRKLFLRHGCLVC